MGNSHGQPWGSGRRDFFVSYTGADLLWARWIAWELEAAGYTTVFQEWDFQAGANFVLEVHRAAHQTHRTVAVLSQRYLHALLPSLNGPPPWLGTRLGLSGGWCRCGSRTASPQGCCKGSSTLTW